MKEVHLKECPSTQEYLKNLLAAESKNEQDFLVSTEKQTQGIGRGSNSWDHYPLGLAFSFTLSPQAMASLTALEMGVLLCQFFSQSDNNIGLKWPNDLFTQDAKKCGGLIIHVHSPRSVIVGIGINLKDHTQGKLQVNYKSPLGFVGPNSLPDDFQRLLPQQIVSFIRQNRLNSKDIIPLWWELCVHKNQPVQFDDGQQKISGVFIGLGEQGEALIESKGEIKKCISGHLTIVP